MKYLSGLLFAVLILAGCGNVDAANQVGVGAAQFSTGSCVTGWTRQGPSVCIQSTAGVGISSPIGTTCTAVIAATDAPNPSMRSGLFLITYQFVGGTAASTASAGAGLTFYADSGCTVFLGTSGTAVHEFRAYFPILSGIVFSSAKFLVELYNNSGGVWAIKTELSLPAGASTVVTVAGPRFYRD